MHGKSSRYAEFPLESAGRAYQVGYHQYSASAQGRRSKVGQYRSAKRPDIEVFRGCTHAARAIAIITFLMVRFQVKACAIARACSASSFRATRISPGRDRIRCGNGSRRSFVPHSGPSRRDRSRCSANRRLSRQAAGSRKAARVAMIGVHMLDGVLSASTSASAPARSVRKSLRPEINDPPEARHQMSS